MTVVVGVPVPDLSSSPSPGEVSADRIADVLAECYELDDVKVTTIPLGTETDNFAADTAQGRLFVKAYPQRADLEVMRGRITLMERGRAAGSPFPAVHPDRDGRLITQHRGAAVSLWDWVDGASSEFPFTAAHSTQIGDALGKLHTALADHPCVGFKANTNHWWAHQAEDLIERGRRILELIDAVPEPCENDQRRRVQVEQRIAQLEGLSELQAGMPARPRKQLVHFDATGANLLWNTKDELVGIIDLQARVAFPTWEVGRVAYEPFTVAESPSWQEAAAAAVAAYAEQVPRPARAELPYAARMALLHNLASWFGIDALYGDRQLPGRAIYARFWDLRAQAAGRMLQALPQIEAELTEAVAG